MWFTKKRHAHFEPKDADEIWDDEVFGKMWADLENEILDETWGDAFRGMLTETGAEKGNDATSAEPKLIVKVLKPGGDLYCGDTTPVFEIAEDGEISCVSHSKEELLSRSWTIR